MKVYVDTRIYVTEKFVNMGYIEVYEGRLRYEKAVQPTIPNFINRMTLLYSHSFSRFTTGKGKFQVRRWHFTHLLEKSRQQSPAGAYRSGAGILDLSGTFPVIQPGEAALAGFLILVAQIQARFLHGPADHVIADVPGTGEEVA